MLLSKSKLYLIITLISLASYCSCQDYINANPFNLYSGEMSYRVNNHNSSPAYIRPIFPANKLSANRWLLKFRSEVFFNDGAPNLENMSDRWIGRGISLFNSINISYSGRFIAFSTEPFIFYSQNRGYEQPQRNNGFLRLNDMAAHTESPYKVSDLRETQLYLHFKHIGLGLSNANLWWGPGIHNTLNMTNNTTGFRHLMVGTLREKRIRNFGVDVRYIFSELDKTKYNPYFASLLISGSVHSKQIISFGLIRTYVAGGSMDSDSVSAIEVARLPFEDLYLINKEKIPGAIGSALDNADQSMSGYFAIDFPESALKIFLEYGSNDHRMDWKDLKSQPDHTSGSVIGLRKYGFSNNINLTFGIEYTRLHRTKFWVTRAGSDWYDRWIYDYSSYNGRRWAAHSGSDSDDLYIYFGYLGEKYSIIPSFDYERHGVIYAGNYPEVKLEYRLDLRYNYKNYKLNLFYEYEVLHNVAFEPGKTRYGSVIWFGVERDLSGFKLPKFHLREMGI